MKRQFTTFALFLFCAVLGLTLQASSSSSSSKTFDEVLKESRSGLDGKDGKNSSSSSSSSYSSVPSAAIIPSEAEGQAKTAPAAKKKSKEKSSAMDLPEWAKEKTKVFSTVPADILPNKKYIIYLVGDLNEMQYKNYKAIIETFTKYGFIIISNPVQNSAYTYNYIKAIANEVLMLLNAGVQPANITVLGYSDGGTAAIKVSALVENPYVNYIIVGGCPKPDSTNAFTEDNIVTPVGRFLNIYDRDDENFGRFTPVFRHVKSKKPRAVQEKRVVSGKGHKFGLEPLNVWMVPSLQFAQ
ncbi:MAG: hypothetical protein PHQ27_08410 [Victivallales bacterium]|nr:hypothetical protein [Victivallales bacterium]